VKKYCVFLILFTAIALYSQNASDISRRVKSRTFPSVFAAWSGSNNARHDLAWHDIYDIKGLRWNTAPVGGYRVLATGFTAASIVDGQNFRQKMLANNPNMILLLNITYRSAKASWLPEDHAWWLRDEDGNKILANPGAEGTGNSRYRLDIANPDFKVHIGKWAKSAVSCGVYDGMMLDWWDENRETDARLALIQEVRSAIGSLYKRCVYGNW